MRRRGRQHALDASDVVADCEVESDGAMADRDRFLTASSRFPTGITVVTAFGRSGEPTGVTVASFTPVSIDPPLILFCLHHGCRVVAELMSIRRFAVNVLSAGQEHLAVRFSSSIRDRFESVAWKRGRTAVPLIRDALASFECGLSHTAPGGDHTIVVGKVEALVIRSGPPLVRFGRAYRSLAELTAVAESGTDRSDEVRARR